MNSSLIISDWLNRNKRHWNTNTDAVQGAVATWHLRKMRLTSLSGRYRSLYRTNVFWSASAPHEHALTRRAAQPVQHTRGRLADWAQIGFFALLVRPLLLLLLGLRLRGGEQLSALIRERRQFILIANHSSHLDTVVLLNLFPLAQLRRLRPVAAADYFERNWLLACLSRTFFNILPIPRTHLTPENHPVARMKAALDAGDSLILFPEGTRGCHEQMQRFRAGIAHLVEEAPDVPILPAYLLNLGRSLPKGECIPLPLFAEARFGTPLCPQGSRAEIIAQLETAVRALQNQQ